MSAADKLFFVVADAVVIVLLFNCFSNWKLKKSNLIFIATRQSDHDMPVSGACDAAPLCDRAPRCRRPDHHGSGIAAYRLCRLDSLGRALSVVHYEVLCCLDAIQRHVRAREGLVALKRHRRAALQQIQPCTFPVSNIKMS